LYAGADYFDHANDEVAVIPMIETKEAVAALNDILAVPGIDAVYVGPADLSISLGLRPGLWNDGEWEQARQKIVRACHAHGVIPGIHASAAIAAKHAEAGYRMIMISHEAGVMAARTAEDAASVLGIAPSTPPTY
jgi:4-hydroxy-2-oxoheptanedioate aldolase